jgi:signal transduction histidine kinase
MMQASVERSRWVALAIASISAALAAAIVILRWINWGHDAYQWLPNVAASSWVIDALGALLWCIPGLLIARRRPDLPFGWLALAAGLGHGLAGAGLEWAVLSELGDHHLPGAAAGLWLASWGSVVELPVLAVIYVLFPHGRRASGGLGLVSLGAPALVLAGVAVQALSPFTTSLGMHPGSPFAGLTNPVALDVLGGLPGGVPFFAVGMLAAGGVVVVRWHRSGGDDRQVLRWLAAVALAGPLVVLAVLLLPPAIGLAVAEIETFLEIATITAVTLRYRVFETELVLNRAWVYTLLTGSLAAVYAGVVALGTAILSDRGASIIGAVVVALCFAPVRTRLQRVVNHVMYGDRDDPYAVLARVGRRLESTLAPETVLPTIVQAVREALKLPYAAITLITSQEGGATSLAAAAGTPVAVTLRLPLVYQHEPVGELVLAPRAPGEPFSPADRRLLEDLARQIGVAAHAVRLTADLQRSRARLVVAREEERRRLRRDLHDGLGPTLASMTLQTEAAQELYATDPARGAALLVDLTGQLQAATVDIRRLVYALRPPALDELGLVGALRAQAVRHEVGRTRIDVLAPDALPPLTAAVEVAAYRIVQEALTNVLRHAEAHTCMVTLTYDDAASILALEVTDDGRGLPDSAHAGVGLSSMRERAEELGGACVIEPLPTGGARVRAILPCPQPDEVVPP